MLEKIKNLSAAAKAGIIGGTVLVAAAAVGLGITQPWNQQEDLIVNDAPPTQQQIPDRVEEPKQPELSVRAGNEVVPCTLYEGDGWSIYLPDGWSAQKNGNNNARLSSSDGTSLSVSFLPGSDYSGHFVNLSEGEEDRTLQFFQGIGEGSPSVSGTGAKSRWDYYGKLFTALARTLTVGEEKPFGDVYIIPQVPDWQEAEGSTVLFLDKDGYIVDSKMQDAVEDYMQSWPEGTRQNYTGQYRINKIQWAGSYTGITQDGYIDVFRADVQYKLRDGASPESGTAVNGWASGAESVFLALSHDGGSVEKTQNIAAADDGDWVKFVTLLQ